MTTLPHSDVVTRQERLAGNDLLDYIKSTSELTHKQRCLGAGYIQADKYEDGTDKPAFTDFFEAIIEAKNDAYVPDKTMNGADWYDSLTDERRELYDAIEDMCPEFTKFDAEQCQEFMDELADIGITTSDQFECSYMYQTDSYNAEAEYAQHYCERIAYVTDNTSMLVIDWQATYDYALKYETSVIVFDGETYFFQNL